MVASTTVGKPRNGRIAYGSDRRDAPRLNQSRSHKLVPPTTEPALRPCPHPFLFDFTIETAAAAARRTRRRRAFRVGAVLAFIAALLAPSPIRWWSSSPGTA